MNPRSLPLVIVLAPAVSALAACSSGSGQTSGPGPAAPSASATATASASAAVDTGEPTCPSRHTIGSVAFDPDGKTLVTSCAGYDMCKEGESLMDVWDLSSGELKKTIDAGMENVLTSTFGPNGLFLTVANPHTGVATVRLFSTADWSIKHDMSFYCTATAHFNPQGTHLGMVGCDGNLATVRLSDMAITRRPEKEAHLGGDYAVAMAYSADGKAIYVDDEVAGFQVLDPTTLKRRSKEKEVPRAGCAALSPKWERYAVMTEEGELSVLEATKPDSKARKLAKTTGVTCSSLIWLDAGHLALATSDGAVQIVDASGKAPARALTGPVKDAGALSYFAVNAAGTALAGVYNAGHIVLWDVASGTGKPLLQAAPLKEDDIPTPPSVEWSPAGDKLAGSNLERYFVWDTAGAKLGEGAVSSAGKASAVVWSPKGDFLAILDGKLRLRRTSDGAEVVLQSVDFQGKRTGIAGSRYGVYSGPDELGRCATPPETGTDRSSRAPA
ncbi:MAG: WD40 repeat domain-containing protein [Polyangiaceae bacterium]